MATAIIPRFMASAEELQSIEMETATNSRVLKKNAYYHTVPSVGDHAVPFGLASFPDIRQGGYVLSTSHFKR